MSAEGKIVELNEEAGSSASLQDVWTLRELSLNFHRQQMEFMKAHRQIMQTQRQKHQALANSSKSPPIAAMEDTLYYNICGRLQQVSLDEAAVLLEQDAREIKSEIDSLTEEIKMRLRQLKPEDNAKLRALIQSHRQRGSGVSQGTLEFALENRPSIGPSEKLDQIVEQSSEKNAQVIISDWDETQDRALMLKIDTALGLGPAQVDDSAPVPLNPFARKSKS